MRGLFGEDAIGLHESGVTLIGSGSAHEVVPADLAERATPENIRARVFAHVERHCAEYLAKGHIARALVAAGGSGRYPGGLWSDWSFTRPELQERLRAARSAAEVEAIFGEFREAIAADAKRYVAVGRSLRKVNSYLRDTLASKLGVPPACLAQGLDLNKFSVKVSDLGDQIRRGEIPAATDAEVETAVRDLAEKRAALYADAIAAVEGMEDLPPALRDALLEHVIAIDSPQKLDVARVVEAARDRLAARAAAIDAALVPGADKGAVYEAMRLFVSDYTRVLVDLFPQGAHVGGEEDVSHGAVLVMASVFGRDGFAGRLADFFARPDVKNDDFYNNSTPAYAALGAAEKTKVHVVMSLLTQESGTAVFTAPALSLDPNGTTTTFSYGGGTQTRTFHLDRDAQGGITIRFENTVRPTHLLVDLDAHPLGAGSELKGGYTLTFSAQQLDTLAHKDFARCDNDNAENTMRAFPPVPQKLIAAVDRLPADFRIALDPDTTFSATLR